ncbi:MAG: viperin family antiviral radical SAM protein [Saprospiraceae bacterium]
MNDSFFQPLPSINFHLWQPCNMRCKFCFARDFGGVLGVLPKGHLSQLDAEKVVRLICEQPFSKITFAGGEPTLCPWLPQLVTIAKQAGLTTMVVTNGTRITQKYLASFEGKLDWIALSVDSVSPKVNFESGRKVPGKSGVLSYQDYCSIVDLVSDAGIRLKVNTTVHRLNLKDSMTSFINYARPERWKIFQVMGVESENQEAINSLGISPDEFSCYINRHAELEKVTRIVPETNEVMRGSYAMVDPAGRFYDTSSGSHFSSSPILDVGVITAYQEVHIDESRFIERGGLWGW